MHGFCVTTTTEELRAHAEAKTGDGDAALDAPSELVQLGSVRHREHSYDGALLAGRGHPQTRRAERQGC